MPLRRARSLSIESLESRHLMAGNVSASVSGPLLTITGDEAGNGVSLTYNATTKTYRVTGVDAAGSPTSLNGQNPAGASNFADFPNVSQVTVKLNGGNDQFSVGSAAAVDTVISKFLQIDMGDGDDQVELGRAGGLANTADPLPRSLRLGTSLHISLGAGNDTLQMASVSVGANLQVFAGDGDDNVNFATTFTPAGATENLLFPVRVRGAALLNMGTGADDLSVKHSFFYGNLLVPDTVGAANMEFVNLSIAKKLDIDTSSVADIVKLDYVHAKQFTLDTNSGVDDIDLTNSRFTTLNLKLGAGRDELLMRAVTTTLYCYLDGGSQGSSLTRGPNNNLRGQWRRNMG